MDDVASVAGATDDVHAPHESVQIKGLVVQDAGCFGVGGVVELEAPIEGESVDVIAADPTTDRVLRFDDPDIRAVDRELAGGRETGEARSDDDDVVLVGHRFAVLLVY